MIKKNKLSTQKYIETLSVGDVMNGCVISTSTVKITTKLFLLQTYENKSGFFIAQPEPCQAAAS